jgi:hypothetical protein
VALPGGAGALAAPGRPGAGRGRGARRRGADRDRRPSRLGVSRPARHSLRCTACRSTAAPAPGTAQPCNDTSPGAAGLAVARWAIYFEHSAAGQGRHSRRCRPGDVLAEPLLRDLGQGAVGS